MHSDNPALRAAGLGLGILGIVTMWPILAIWVVFGKKPPA